jgi:hypothetical protein
MRRIIGRLIASGDDLPAATVPSQLSAGTLNKFVAQTIVSSGVIMGVFLVTPFLVSVFADTKQGALFALSLSIVQGLGRLCRCHWQCTPLVHPSTQARWRGPS